jgi:hypothetical protein
MSSQLSQKHTNNLIGELVQAHRDCLSVNNVTPFTPIPDNVWGKMKQLGVAILARYGQTSYPGDHTLENFLDAYMVVRWNDVSAQRPTLFYNPPWIIHLGNDYVQEAPQPIPVIPPKANNQFFAQAILVACGALLGYTIASMGW